MHPHFVRAAPAGPRFRRTMFAVTVAAAVAAAPQSGIAQLVTPRTVPVFQSNQFGVIPSVTAGMAGVSIAIDDTLADAFVNPAKAARLRGGTLFLAPFRHNISGSRGGGRTFPIGGTASVGAWAVGGAFALQSLDRAGPMRFSQFNSDRTATNQYLSLTAARPFGRGVSLGVSGSFAALGAVDGVDLLYSGSNRIDQLGSSADVRVGLTRDLAPGRTFEVIVLHNRYEMTHDVRFPGRFTPANQPPDTGRTDLNDDRTDIWGAHVEYTQPVGTEGWRVGWLATVNRLTHPRIPNYVLQSLPRDPGSTLAYNAGVGLARVFGASTLALDLVLEPMSSTTWADAATDTAIVGGGVIKAGGKTVENDFKFTNSLIRAGLSHEVAAGGDTTAHFGFQLGLALYSINYTLGQRNNIQKTFRTQREHWTEWTPTLGLSFRTPGMTLRYDFSRTCTAGDCMPPLSFGGDRVTVASPGTADAGRTTVIAAPSSPLTFASGTASMHRIWMAVPIR